MVDQTQAFSRRPMLPNKHSRLWKIMKQSFTVACASLLRIASTLYGDGTGR
jgi:hypothetical protein